MKKRQISLLLTGTMTAMLLAGCGAAPTPSGAGEGVGTTAESVSEEAKEAGSEQEGFSAAEPVEISFWCNFTGSDGDVLREIVDEYNSTNDDNIKVAVDIMDYGTLLAKLPTAVSTGTGPSFILAGIELINEYATNGMLEDISDFWDATDIDKSNFYDNVLEKGVVDGVQYGVPMQYNLQYLYYNKDLFEQAGLDPELPPATFEELAEAAGKLTDSSKGIYGLALPKDYGAYVQYLWGNGGDVIDINTDQNLLVSDENRQTLRWLQELAGEGVSPAGLTAAEADTMFQSGQVAMSMSGPWNINGLNALGMNYGIAAIPAGTAGAYSAEGGCCWMLTKGADETVRDAVYRFMAYWLSDPVLKKWSVTNGFPVWSKSVLKDSEIQSNEILSDVSAASTIGRDWHLGYSYGSQIDSDVMAPLMEKVLAGEDVEAALQEASDTLDSIVGK
ncbi:ABC transporter substrate-binding protein [Lachnoclostridium sp. Marseille-P6806]|uniref:ABC transporter substrate-binding protein n=1 Tax=Lachnoclostridium sp. Marseille-P6806 TaxID=2364793 RepID=UPI00103028F9|nr:ABC transporter substrate-binding protein [Lachnoclostridium sp. Marseille-P6806]